MATSNTGQKVSPAYHRFTSVVALYPGDATCEFANCGLEAGFMFSDNGLVTCDIHVAAAIKARATINHYVSARASNAEVEHYNQQQTR